MNQDPYPALGAWFVQFWEGADVAARVYGNDAETLRRRCAAITAPQSTQAQAGAVTPPPIECNTEDLKKAYAFGWWSALEKQRETAQAGAVPLTDEQIDAAWQELQTRRAAQAAKDFNARIGQKCSQCGAGAYRADGNGYHSFHRCDACNHVPFFHADGKEWTAPNGIGIKGGQHG